RWVKGDQGLELPAWRNQKVPERDRCVFFLICTRRTWLERKRRQEWPARRDTYRTRLSNSAHALRRFKALVVVKRRVQRKDAGGGELETSRCGVPRHERTRSQQVELIPIPRICEVCTCRNHDKQSDTISILGYPEMAQGL